MPTPILRLNASTSGYPARLRAKRLVDRYPELWVIGDACLLTRPLLGLLCSMRCPGQVILKTYDLARSLRDAAVPVIGGFHSPMERECLDLLLRGSQPVVVCPARSLEHMRVPVAWRPGIDAGRVLVVSPFAGRHRRVTAVLAQERNQLVGSLAREIIIPHADLGGQIHRLCREFASSASPVWTLDGSQNSAAVEAGARLTTSEEFIFGWSSRNA